MPKMIEKMFMIADKMADKMAGKIHKRDKTKETAEPKSKWPGDQWQLYYRQFNHGNENWL